MSGGIYTITKRGSEIHWISQDLKEKKKILKVGGYGSCIPVVFNDQLCAYF